jgi:endonuclease/exonuclease/phosphatase family metal-dependent hydrolase
VRLVGYNIQYGVGKDGKLDLARAIGAVDGADIVALQEVERNWPKSGMADQVAEIERLMPGYFCVYGPYFDVDASMRAADGTVVNRRRQHGLMLLSRWPIRSSRLFPLPKLDNVTGLGFQMGMLEGVIDVPGRPLRVYSIHLSSLASEERILQAEELLRLWWRTPAEGATWSGERTLAGVDWSSGEEQPPAPTDTVMLGDFNTRPGTPEYRLLIGEQPGGRGGIHFRMRLCDTWLLAGDGGPGVTFPASTAYPAARMGSDGIRIDYGFVSGSLAPLVTRAWVDSAAQGSDHQPYWFELDF